MLYAYCIRRAADAGPEPSLTGVDDAPVECVTQGTLALWASACTATPGPTVEHVREHNGVVVAALRSATPLPLRFGAVFPDKAAARAALRANADVWTAALARVADHVEMSILVGWDRDAEARRLHASPPTAEPPTSGREYLEQRRQRQAHEDALRARAEMLLNQVAGIFAELSAETAHHLLLTREAAGSVAHLVHRSALERHRQMFERARAGSSVPLQCSGPWAPYSFV